MKAGLLSLVACLACCVVGLASSPVAAFGEGSPPAKGTGASSSLESVPATSGPTAGSEELLPVEREAQLAGLEAELFGEGSSAGGSSSEGPQTGAAADVSSSLAGSLVTSGSPAEGEELQAGEEAKLASPEAVALREASRTRFENLNTEQAAKVAGEAFPTMIDDPAGGPPKLLAGQSITRFPADNVASIDLGEGKRGLIESTQPMAIETSSGHRTPIDLGLSDAGSVFEPKTPMVGVQIPKRLSDGVQLPALGVSLTPVDAPGASLGGSEGAVDGEIVFYANTQTDTDTIVKPVTDGFETDTLLRSVESPDELYFRVGLPEGASLVQTGSGSGAVKVLEDGTEISQILPPGALDAAGTSVPVSMSVTGDVLALTVASHEKEYQWPISVDPTVIDNQIAGPEGKATNWVSRADQQSHFTTEGDAYLIQVSHGSIETGEYVESEYHTQGNSKISLIEGDVYEEVPHGRSFLQFFNEDWDEPEVESTAILGENGDYGGRAVELCAREGESPCAEWAGDARNFVRYKQEELEPDGFLYSELWDTKVHIYQTEGPDVYLNKTEVSLKEDSNRENVTYGSGSWLTPTSGAFEMKVVDPGVGVSGAGAFETSGGPGSFIFEDPIYKDGYCKGVQCNESYHADFTYNPSMSDGEDKFELWAEDLAGYFGEIGYANSEAIIKVDSTPPYNLGFTGMPEAGAEISATQHKLTVHATDGTKPTISSGVKSISVSIDGGQKTVLPGSSCSPGECTASAAYTLNAEDLTEGVHRLTVSAIDNAGNVAPAKEFTFDVRHGNPVPVGPGTVDPTTGQFKLSATDVSLSGTGGVSRVYQSRNLTAGAEGPLGPQWAISLGGGEGLTVLPNGSVVLTGSSGGVTTFTRNSKGEFESPLGDSSIRIEAKEKEKGKGVTEYTLTNSAAGATTTFTQPTGTESTAPLYTNQFGSEGGSLVYPESEAVDASENVWIADVQNSRIEKFSPTGALLGTYGGYGSEDGQFIGPWGIAVSQSTGNVYVTDQANNRLVELNSSGGFVQAMGWGVTNGSPEFQICKSACKAGIAGSGGGQFDVMAGVSVDSSGNVWVADYGNDRIEEFNAEGKYVQAFGTKGKGEVQFEGPLNIAFSGGNLYVADYGNNRVEELSTAGKYIYQWGKEGTGNSEFKQPRGIATDPRTGNLYVTDAGNDRVQEFSSSGTFITKFGSVGSGAGQLSVPTGVVVDSLGNVYVSDYDNNRLEEWTRPTWLPKREEGPLKSVAAAYAYKPVEEEGKTVIEPVEELAATPSGVTCGVQSEKELEVKELKKGCRALAFEYATNTEENIGEKETEWGEYKGHLNKVILHAYNPAPGGEKMEEKTVAEYAYDKQGRLRAEWDPRIEASMACGKACPALKTTYGYDAEDHVTALTPPGQQPWAFTYGTIGGESNTGRLLKVTQAHPKASWTEGKVKEILSEQKELPENYGRPKIVGSPIVGVKMSVSTGAWEYSPVVYGFQWEDCNSAGKECTPILGATNAYYKPQTSDVGDTLLAKVTATNSGGSVVAASVVTAEVTSSTTTGGVTQLIDSGHSLNAVSCIPSTTDCVVSDSAGKALYATNVSTTASATWNTWSGPSGESPSQAIDCPTSSLCLLADGKETAGGKLYYATSLGGSFSEAYNPSDGVDAISCVSSSFCVDGQDGGGYFRYSTSPASTSWTLEEQGKASMKGAFCLSTSFCAIADGSGSVHVATSTSQIESSTWKETDVDGSSALNGIACTSTTSCVAVDGVGNALKLTIEKSSGTATAAKHDIDGTTSLTDVTCFGSSTCVAVDASGNVFVSKNAGETWTKEYVLGDKLTSVSCTSTSLCATVDTTGNITAFNLAGGGVIREGEATSPQPGATIEYHVPVSGAGTYAPNLSKGEVEKWGQKDAPTEGMALFPPDEPQTWPASGYKRATIDYLDEKARTVNRSSPTGGVATSEYNEANETTRTLSADNRATALNEGCISVPKECKSAEVAEKLDTKAEYNPEDSQIVKVVGPEHKVKLSTGTEVQARAVSHDYYDKGAKEVEEKTHESYDLLTSSTDGALLSNGEEKDTRETVMSYSGQEDLGWKLRKPTSVTKEPSGLNLTTTTVYQESENAKKERESTGAVVETRSAKDSGSGSPVAPVYLTQFGSAGTGTGQFKGPVSDAVDASGDVWVTDYNNSRVEEFSALGGFIKAIGWGVTNGKSEYEICTSSCEAGISGSGEKQFSKPAGIAISPMTGNVYVVDKGNNRIEEFEASGTFVRTFGTSGSGKGQLNNPLAIAITPTGGEVWVGDAFNQRVDEFSETGTPLGSFGKGGTGNGEFSDPDGIAFSSGDAYVVDIGNDRVQEFSMSGKYIAKFGSKGAGNGQFESPYGITADPVSGDLYVGDAGNDRIEAFAPGGAFLDDFGKKGSGDGELLEPEKVAINTAGDIYVSDVGNNRIQEFEPIPSAPAYTSEFGAKGTGNGQFTEPRGVAIAKSGNVYALDTANSRVEEFSPSGTYLNTFGASGTEKGQLTTPYAMTVDSKGNVWIADTADDRVDEFNEKREWVQAFGWGVSNGEAKLEVCTTSCKAGTAGSGTGELNGPKGIAVTTSGALYVADSANNRVEEFSEKGEFIAAFGFGISNEKAEYEICTSGCKAGIAGSGNGQFNNPCGVAVANGTLWVTDVSNSRIEEFNEKDEYLSKFGAVGSGDGQFKEPKAVAIDPSGNVWVADDGNNRVQELTPSGTFLTTLGDKGKGNGQFEEPWGIAFGTSGAVYVADDKNNRIQKWILAPRPGNEGAHMTRTAYYSAEEESEVAACRKHPEWANLPCQTEPAAQPGIAASPELPITTMKYNIWDELEVTEEHFGTTVRKKTQTYDPAGRSLTSEEKAEPATDIALPEVTNQYNETTGALEVQKATIAGKEKTITSKDNTLGQLVEYTDAEGNVAKYVYEEGGDGRLLEMSQGKGEEAKSSQAYTYSGTTGFMEKLVDAQGTNLLTFTASYGVEGEMTSEVYPNGMCANTTHNSVGMATSLEYIKTKTCSEKGAPEWFSDSDVPSIHGETLEQSSTLAKEKYKYDAAGRLIEAEETPTGKGCVSRVYGYDEESNRTSLTSRESATETCASEGGVVQGHAYDSANRLIDSGVEYETFGNTTKMPAIDAGEHAITNTYYVDNQVASQTQNEETFKYTYDPAGRPMETVSEGKTASTVISHYAGSGGSPTWTSEGTEKWTRNIPGIDGALDAIQTSAGSTVLQLHDLQGNIVGTAALSEAETKLLSTYNSTEFGVPQPGTTPPKYAWLGAEGVSSEPSLSAGVSSQGGASYVPQVARSLQTDPVVPPGAFPNGSGNESPYTSTIAAGIITLNEKESAGVIAEYIAKQEALKRKAEQEALETAERIHREEGERGAAPSEGGAEELGEEGEEEAGQEVTLEIMGSGAHAASDGVIICNAKVNDPHNSIHGPGTVNVVAKISCPTSEIAIFIRVALFYEGRQVAGGGNESYGRKELRANAAAGCQTGYYQGWAEFLGQGVESNPAVKLEWGPRAYIRC